MILYYIILYYIILYNILQYYTILYYTLLYYLILLPPPEVSPPSALMCDYMPSHLLAGFAADFGRRSGGAADSNLSVFELKKPKYQHPAGTSIKGLMASI